MYFPVATKRLIAAHQVSHRPTFLPGFALKLMDEANLLTLVFLKSFTVLVVS
jgi:hypothetical protein